MTPTHRGLGYSRLFQVVLLAVCTLAGLGHHPAWADPAEPRIAPDAAKPRIAIVMKALTNPYFSTMAQGAQQAARELNVTLDIRTVSEETSISQQISIIRDLTEQHVAAIVVAPVDSVQVIPALKAARDAGIVLVNVDNRLSPKVAADEGLGQVPFISVDNAEAAYQAVKVLAGSLTGPAEVAVLEGFRMASNAQARNAGALRAFAERKDTSVVARESANWQMERAFDLTRDMMAAHPAIKAMFCANDMMAIGAVAYLRGAGLHVAVAGYDALPEALDAVKKGDMLVTVDQQADRQGYLGVSTAVALLKGQVVPAETMVPFKLVRQGS